MDPHSLETTCAAPVADPTAIFFAALRRKGFHLGLDPEFTGLETLCLAPPAQQLATMREHIDQFFWGRGSEVLAKVLEKARQEGNVNVTAMLEGLAGFVSRLLTGQFNFYPKGRQIPQPGMLREILAMTNNPETHDLNQRIEDYIDQHLDDFDGHFFMAISESLRHSRARGYEANLLLLPILGRHVSYALHRRDRPCNFAILFQPWTESAVRLAIALGETRSDDQLFGLLVSEPMLSSSDLMEVIRHPAQFGLPPAATADFPVLNQRLPKILQALEGELDPSISANLYGYIAMTCRIQEKLTAARRFYRFSFANATLPWEKAAALSGIGILEMMLHDPGRAETYFQQALDLCRHARQRGATLACTLMHLGEVRMDDGRLEEAEGFFEEASAIVVENRSRDLFVQLRLKQAELAVKANNPELATVRLDDIQWIEGSGMPFERLYLQQRNELLGKPEEAFLLPKDTSIEALRRRLLGPSTTLDKVGSLRALGHKFLARTEGSRTDNVQAAASFWEQSLALMRQKGIVPDDEPGDDGSVRAFFIEMHASLGMAYNELSSTENSYDDAVKARTHLESALQLLPDQPKYAQSRTELLNNVANAMAWEASQNPDFLFNGIPDRRTLLNSLTMQSELLERMEDDPAGRIQVLENLSQTYRDLADGDATRDGLYEAAWDCLQLATQEMELLPSPAFKLVASLAIARSRTARPLKRPASELHDLALEMDRLLAHDGMNELDIELCAYVFREAARLAEHDARPAKAYRYLLRALRWLSRNPEDATSIKSTSAIERIGQQLVVSMIAAGSLHRVAFYAATSPITRKNLYPKGKNWKPLDDHAVLLFARKSKTTIAAIVVSSLSVQSAEVPLGISEPILAGVRLLNATRTLIEDDTAAAKQQSEIDAVTETIAALLFRPLEAILPPTGFLTIVLPSWLPKLPLHLARLGDGRRLFERFNIAYGSRLAFRSTATRVPLSPPARTAFVASFSPQDARLPFGVLEAHAIGLSYRRQQVVVGLAATPEKVLDGLRNSSHVHLCCHGEYDWQSPQDSRLSFAGRPLTVREVELALAQAPCDIVVLSACEAGMSRVGGDSVGFASALLHAGCGAVIAADWRVNDLATAILMESLHAALAEGTQAAAALALAQRAMSALTASAVAARVRAWLDAASGSLDRQEQTYIASIVQRFEARQNDQVFAHSAFWGSFALYTEAVSLHPRAGASPGSRPGASRTADPVTAQIPLGQG